MEKVNSSTPTLDHLADFGVEALLFLVNSWHGDLIVLGRLLALEALCKGIWQ